MKQFVWPHYLLPQKKPLQNLKYVWKLGSAIVMPTVATLSKLWMNYFNTVHIVNHRVFLDALQRNYDEKRSALITISNHNCCLDDPLLWGAFYPWRWNLIGSRHRWSTAAEDICFTRSLHVYFFTLGKTFPVIRGEGIYQSAMDFAIELLNDKQFLHVFPQGKVVEDQEAIDPNQLSKPFEQLSLRDPVDTERSYDFKWGIARLILEAIDFDSSNNSSKYLELLPFYHIGMNRVLPNVKPYIPQAFKKVTVCFREEGPIVFDKKFIVETCCNGNYKTTTRERRIGITRYLEWEMKRLKLRTMREFHKQSDKK
ncbi:Tafazzin-like Acyltransferase [Dinothrombium tinctorium]|uniref:Tafazzin family protein n=1 Tax=Dinothrombium tinctorium TaxID=1965070 RepID=A0A3S4R3H1_9ACAR|nr:Tafazzin-like Acyltransferase [Dinothrombium tinctorium]